MRTRTRNKRDVVTTTEWERDNTNGSKYLISQATDVTGEKWTYDLMIDEVTPQFKRRQQQGHIIMSPCERVESTVVSTTVPKLYEIRGYNSTNVLTVSTTGWAEAPWSAQRRIQRVPTASLSAEARASELAAYGSLGSLGDSVLQKALLRATSPDALALVTMAEFDKTVDLVTTAGKYANKAARLLESLGPTGVKHLNRALSQVQKRGYLRRGGRKRLLADVGATIAAAASTWLGYRYGVMATYYDMKSWTDSFSPRKRVRFTATTDDRYDYDPGWVLQNSNYLRKYYTRVTRSRTSKIRAGVLITPEGLSQGSRLGLDRIASTAWELVPFSFVFDWFVDVGGRIAAHEGNFIVQPLGSWLTYEHTLYFSSSYDYRYDSQRVSSEGLYWYSWGQNSGTVSEICLYTQRFANPRLSILPSVKVKLNTKRMLDAVSLLAVNARRIRSFL